MKKIIFILILSLAILLLSWCSNNDNLDTNLNKVDTLSWVTNETPVIQELTNPREVTIYDDFTLVSIEDPSEYKFISKNKEWNELEFLFRNKTVNADKYLINNINNWWFWNDSDVKICYRQEINKQIFYNINNKKITFDEFQYDSVDKRSRWILKMVYPNRQDELWSLLQKQWYFTDSNWVNPNLLCKCKNWKTGNIDNDKKYKVLSLNDDFSFSFYTSSWSSITFTEKNLNKLKMTAWLKKDCYEDLLREKIQWLLYNKEFVLKDYEETFSPTFWLIWTWEIMLYPELWLSLVDMLQRQGFIENECNTNDIEPMLMKMCQK